jgi:hypothetical protein
MEGAAGGHHESHVGGWNRVSLDQKLRPHDRECPMVVRIAAARMFARWARSSSSPARTFGNACASRRFARSD